MVDACEQAELSTCFGMLNCPPFMGNVFLGWVVEGTFTIGVVAALKMTNDITMILYDSLSMYCTKKSKNDVGVHKKNV